MTSEFSAYCIFTMVLAILAIIGITPLMWDAAGYVQNILEAMPTFK